MNDQTEDVVGNARSEDDCILNTLRNLNTSEVGRTDSFNGIVAEGGNQIGFTVTFKCDTVGFSLGLGDCSWYNYALTVTGMRANVKRAESNDCAADSKEDHDDHESEENTAEFAAEAELEGTPVDVFRCRHFFILDHKFFAVEEILRLRFIDTATAAAPHTAVRAIIEEIVIVEVGQAVYL